jgi:hypothetical protein
MANSTKKSQRIKPIESLNEQSGVLSSLASHVDTLELLQQMLGVKIETPASRKDFKPGESIEISKSTSTKKENETKKTFLGSPIFSEAEREANRKLAELRAELDAIIREVKVLAKSTQNIKEEVKNISQEETPPKPGTYHLIFFEEILKIIKNARLEIEKASVWFSFASQRAQKKNYWARYKKGGSSFLLSPDHYLTRSAG